MFAPDNEAIVNAQKELQTASQDMQKQFEEQSANMSDEEKAQLFEKMQGEMSERQEKIQKGLKDKLEEAVGSVASTKGLSLVVDKSVVLYGGQDITDQVAKQLTSSK